MLDDLLSSMYGSHNRQESVFAYFDHRPGTVAEESANLGCVWRGLDGTAAAAGFASFVLTAGFDEAPQLEPMFLLSSDPPTRSLEFWLSSVAGGLR